MPAPASPDSRNAVALQELLLESAEAVRAVLAGQSLTEVLAQVPAAYRAGTQALSFYAMRRLGEARAVRGLLVPRTPPEPLAEGLLLVSLCLLLPVPAGAAGVPAYPPHTVVDQAVRAAASMTRLAPFKGLVNGCLRGFLREHDSLMARVVKQVEGRWNHPQWWVDRLRAAYPDNWQDILTAANEPPPMTLRVNARRASREQVLQAFADARIGARPAGASGVMLDAPRPVTQLPGFEAGWWSVQDAGAQLAAPLLEVRDGMRVLDACAAPGGKTAHLLEMADLDLTALDADARRLQRVGANLERLGLLPAPASGRQVLLRAGDATQPDGWWDGRPFDAILADVPCTASGIVRRHPDIRWLRRADDVGRTAALQTRIADALWPLVAAGGRLLYVTCSVFPQEGERQAAAFAARHADAVRLPAPGQLLPCGPATVGGLQHDGFFYALFAKAG